MFKIKRQKAACGEPGRRGVLDPSATESSRPWSSPVGCCGRRERLQHCEDARRWDNEFIAACHPAMAISTIRHCTLPLKGRASPTTPTLPGPRLILGEGAGSGGGWSRKGKPGRRKGPGLGKVEEGTKEVERGRKGEKSIWAGKQEISLALFKAKATLGPCDISQPIGVG